MFAYSIFYYFLCQLCASAQSCVEVFKNVKKWNYDDLDVCVFKVRHVIAILENVLDDLVERRDNYNEVQKQD